MADIQYDNPDRNARALEAVVNIQASEIAKQKVEMQKLVLFIGDLQGVKLRGYPTRQAGRNAKPMKDLRPAEASSIQATQQDRNSSEEASLGVDRWPESWWLFDG